MKDLKDFLLGVGGLFVLGGTIAWDYLKKFWKDCSEAQKSVLLALAIVLIAFSVVGVVRAENAPDSNFGAFATDNGDVVYMCYTSTSEQPKIGIIYTCLVTYPIAPGALVTRGQVSFCTITNYVDDMPYVDCGPYDDMALLSGGI